MQNSDVHVVNHGTVWTFRPITDRAKAWLEDRVESEPWQWFGDRLVVDHRLAAPLAEGVVEAGLSVGL